MIESVFRPWMIVISASLIFISDNQAQETFQPYLAADVPRSVAALWQAYDPRLEPLDVEVVKQWETDGVVTRYVTFTVGTFKGSKSRIAAYYSFPKDQKNCPAFVWSHGGGQRAERSRGIYFAQQGYATVDINWLGRPLEKEISVNTDWGNVDPTQGPQFYPGALRKGWKTNLQPDAFSIDSVVSPRNANWFLLAVAARRAITFLEQQNEVAADKIGFSGFSMGGMITALTAPDVRLKAVAPFVGGTGFKYVDFPGIEGSSLRVHFRDLELYKDTIDASGYWPHVKCPVMFISSTNDFHSTFERIYQSMDLLPHDQWRVSSNVHQNHGPGPEQWVMLNLWFDQHLKGIQQDIPNTPPSTLTVVGDRAVFRVYPEGVDRLVDTEIYYSYDPNSRTRFWHRALAESVDGAWSVDLAVESKLPLYVFALCRYRLDGSRRLQRDETTTFTINSREHVLVPETVNLVSMKHLQKDDEVFEDFEHGIMDWSSRNGRSIKTYKFQSPKLNRSNEKRLALTVDPKGKSLTLRLTTNSQFLNRDRRQGDFSFETKVEGTGLQKILIDREDFKNKDGHTLEWAKVATFTVTILDRTSGQPLVLTDQAERSVLQRIELVD